MTNKLWNICYQIKQEDSYRQQFSNIYNPLKFLENKIWTNISENTHTVPFLRHSILHYNTQSIKLSSKKQFNYLNQINFPNFSNNGDLVGRVSTITIRISQKIGNTATRDVNWDYCLGPNRTQYRLFRLKPSLHPPTNDLPLLSSDTFFHIYRWKVDLLLRPQS